MAASSNHCPVLSYLGPCTLEFRPQHLTDAVWPDKYLGVASIGVYKWKIWDQGTYVLSSRDRWQKITLCVTRLRPTPRYTGNKLHLLRHSPAVVAWGQHGHMARPGFAEPLSSTVCVWFLTASCIPFPAIRDESGTAAPAGELTLMKHCVFAGLQCL